MRAYRVAYDGRCYHGFQRQPDVRTVEGTLLRALERLGVTEAAPDGPSSEPTDEDGTPPVPDGYAAAGRTDAGVSAVAQTVALAAPDWLSPRAWNSELPADVRVWASASVAEDFHATHDATSRHYTYYLFAPAADRSLGEAALERLAGTRDFHNLTPDAEGTVRTLTASLRRDGEFLVVDLRAGGFCRQLARRLVGLLAAVARGEAAIEKVDRVLAAEPLTGPAGVAPAPAAPLVLTGVDYPGVRFDRDAEAAVRAAGVFDARRANHLANAQVADRLREGVGGTDTRS